jgi:hypothetical protein
MRGNILIVEGGFEGNGKAGTGLYLLEITGQAPVRLARVPGIPGS